MQYDCTMLICTSQWKMLKELLARDQFHTTKFGLLEKRLDTLGQEQGSATYGPPSKIIRPAATLPNCTNCTTRQVVLYFMNLPSLQHLVLHTYEKPHCAINVLYVAFLAFVVKYENQELICFNSKNAQDLTTAKRTNWWWETSTARHTLQSLFLARDSGKVADPWSRGSTEEIKTQQPLKTFRSFVCRSCGTVGYCTECRSDFTEKRFALWNIFH